MKHVKETVISCVLNGLHIIIWTVVKHMISADKEQTKGWLESNGSAHNALVKNSRLQET